MAHPASLVPGNCYFLVTFYDEDLIVPCIETFVFKKQELDDEGEKIWIFEEPITETASSEEKLDDDEPILIGFRADTLYQLIELDGLVRKVNELSDYHPIKIPDYNLSAFGIEEKVLSELKSNIKKFVSDPKYYSLTITKCFTDSGLSLARRENNEFDITFYSHPKLDITEEHNIFKFFDKLKINPCTNYLADKGRTRILHYPISSDFEDIVNLCVRVLQEIHQIRNDDGLDYHFLTKSNVE